MVNGMEVSATVLLVGGALVVGLFAAWLCAWKMEQMKQQWFSLGSRLIGLTLLGLIGARIAFVLQHWGRYQSSPLTVFDLHDGGYSRLAGVAVALAGTGVLLWRETRLRRALAVTFGASTLTLMLGTGGLLYARQPRSDAALPAGAFATIDGAVIRFDALRGRPLVINLWATWCPPCRQEMPVLHDAQRQRGDVAFVFADQGEDMETVNRYLEDQHLHLFNVVLDAKRVIAQDVHSKVLPTTLFFDAQGRLQDVHLGALTPVTLQEKLKKIAPPETARP